MNRKKEHKIIDPKKCKKCENIFHPGHPSEKYCHNPCTPGKTNAERWLERKGQNNVLYSDQVAYGFFRKKYGTSKKFKACRG